MAFPRTFCPCVGKRVRRWDADEKGFISAPCPVCDPPQGWLGCDLRAPAQNPHPAVEKDALDRQRGMTAWAKALWHREAAPAEPGVFQPLPEVGKDTSGGEAQRAHVHFVSQARGGRT